MKTIVIKTQAELDALPESFTEYTVIEIRSEFRVWVNKSWENSSVVARGNSRVVARGNSRVVARGNSRVEAWGNSRVVARGNSRVEAWENSRVEAWENSRVEAWGNSRVVARGNSRVEAWENSRVEAWENSRVDVFLCATLFVYSAYVIIKSLRDNARLVYKTSSRNRPEKYDPTATIVEFENIVTPTFEQWLERGYVVADGIERKLVSKKKTGDVTIFKVSDFHGKESFVVKRGGSFAHGETVKEAMNDLKFKISDRDTTRFKSWTLETIATQDEMIEAYRKITGACAAGVKGFLEQRKLPKKLTVLEVIGETQGCYGGSEFEKFFIG